MQPDVNVDIRGAQLFYSPAIDSTKRIRRRDHGARYSSVDQGIGARRSATLMAARLEIAVKSRTSRVVAGHLDRIGFAMLEQIVAVIALTADPPVLDQHRANQ